jgi:hypothetical protein
MTKLNVPQEVLDEFEEELDRECEEWLAAFDEWMKEEGVEPIKRGKAIPSLQDRRPRGGQ